MAPHKFNSPRPLCESIVQFNRNRLRKRIPSFYRNTKDFRNRLELKVDSFFLSKESPVAVVITAIGSSFSVLGS
ncbi:hypothetical protein GOP47_0004971 [Adiantum capillus-veneris]|uniref:Uncharacterized protein n=1 Tax=Adiantum capillus-veneris TaxID=13818 RepID=A0A9D4ZMT4_ADICA|nr:hypothetical protein GOP47_0004971 [Adiantum capillus-veneris]